VTNAEFGLKRDQRNEILRAVKAIERQLKEMAGKPQWQVAWVIGTNLAIIQASVTNMPRATSN
jgi:hypothetical protein